MSESTFLMLNLFLVVAIIFVGRIALNKRREVKKAKQEQAERAANQTEAPGADAELDPIERAKLEERQQLERIKRKLEHDNRFLGAEAEPPEPAPDAEQPETDPEHKPERPDQQAN